MTKTRVVTIPVLGALLGTSLLYAGDLSSYHGFQFGMSVSAAAKQAGIQASEARMVHQQPAVIQELDWLPRTRSLTDPALPDSNNVASIKDGLLQFYNGELFRIVINYDRYKVEGLTPADMIQAISAAYGLATKPTAQIPYHSNYAEAAAVLARWEDPEYSYNLVRSGDQSSFAMIMYSKRLQKLADASLVEALRLEAQAAPQKAIDLQKKQDEDSRLVLEKARSANMPNFRP